jgi:plasmid stabilization system protein ParE
MSAEWTDRANLDLMDQCAWLRAQSADAADLMFEDIMRAADRLASGRDTGRPHPSFPDARFKSILKWNKVLAY